MSMAIGTVEVRSLAFAIEAADTAVKAAPVEIIATSYALPGVVAVSFRGSVDAVAAAADAVKGRLGPAGAMHGVSVIGRPDAAVDQLLKERSIVIGRRAGAPAVPGRGLMHAPAERAAAPAAPATPAAAPAATTTSEGRTAKPAATPKKAATTAKKPAKRTASTRTSNRQGSRGRDSGTGRGTKGER
jgi:microcompartment protein CcmL/EutN